MFKLTDALKTIEKLTTATDTEKFLMKIFAAIAAESHKEESILWKKPPREWTLDEIINYISPLNVIKEIKHDYKP